VIYFEGPAPSAVPQGAVVGAAGPPALACGGLGYARALAIGVAAVAIVAVGIYPQPILGPIQTAASHFVALGA